MNGFIFIAQAFMDYQTRLQTEKIKSAGLRAAEMGRRLAFAGIVFALAMLLLFSSVLLAVIDLGLQIDKHNGISFSGLMTSATLLAVLALIAAAIGWFVGRDAKHVPIAEPGPAATSELRTLLETIAITLLKEFMAYQHKRQSDDADSANTTTRGTSHEIPPNHDSKTER